MAANNCELCGKTFASTNPRTFVQNHAVCKSCKAKLESTGAKDWEKAKELAEQQQLEAKRQEEQEEAERKRLEEQKAKEYAEQIIRTQAAIEEVEKYETEKPVFSIDGSRGRHITVYPNKCVITTTITVGSVVTGNATDGEKTIYYIDVTGLQYKAAGLLIGYIQFETCSGQMNNLKDNFFSENTFTFGDPIADKITENDIKPVLEYIKYRIDIIKQARIKQLTVPALSPADEILKYKNLLDIGAVTPEEYETKKKQLLNL